MNIDLTTPLTIRGTTLHTRLVMPPIATYRSDDGKVTAPMIEYYGARAKGGRIGLLITEHSFICDQGIAKTNQLSIADDSDVEGLKKLTDAIHKDGTKCLMQMSHAGSATTEAFTKGLPLVSASAVPNPSAVADAPIPAEMTVQQIEALVSHFAGAARRAMEAGYDGVEIHSAHGYLLNQFFSPLTNKRTDAYTGSTLEGRTRLHLEVIKAVREAVGPDAIVALRLGACDYMNGGTTKEDSAAAAKLFEKAGVDLLDISGGMCRFARPGHTEEGFFAELSEAIKKEVSIPVILTGGITTRETADQLLSEGKADLIGIGRPIMKDAAFSETLF